MKIQWKTMIIKTFSLVYPEKWPPVIFQDRLNIKLLYSTQILLSA